MDFATEQMLIATLKAISDSQRKIADEVEQANYSRTAMIGNLADIHITLMEASTNISLLVNIIGPIVQVLESLRGDAIFHTFQHLNDEQPDESTHRTG